MTNALSQLRPALVVLIAFTIITGLAYPLAVTGVAQVVFPHRADGSLVHDADGNVVGSSLIGQQFSDPSYFWGRPSAVDYDGANSAGSNLGPTSQKLRDLVTERAAALREANGLSEDAQVPAELVTASASGLDPHISPDSAVFQAQRVADARGLELQQVLDLIDEHKDGRILFFMGEERVNVLELNMALDALGQ